MDETQLCDDHLQEGIWRELHICLYHMPASWGIVAFQLKRAADVLYHEVERALEAQEEYGRTKAVKIASLDAEYAWLMLNAGLKDTYLMLVGLAMENLTKGILVSSNEGIYKGDEFRYRTHGLTSLFACCGVKLDDKEKALVGKLTEYVTWKGRYPMPASKDDIPSRSQTSDKDLLNHGLIEALYERLQKCFLECYGSAGTRESPRSH